MKATDHEQARRLGEYVDDMVMKRRSTALPSDPLSPEDQEFEALRDLAAQLSTAQVAPPPGFQEALRERLRQGVESPVTPSATPAPARSLRDWFHWPVMLPVPPRVALTAATILLATLFLTQSVIDQPVLSAQVVLRRSDDALEALVGPGQVLYRKWRVQSSGGPGMMTGTSQPGRVIEEWMDGADSERVAARWYTLDGRLQVAYTTVMSEGEYRPHVYFSPGLYGEAQGLLNIEPTMKEFSDALSSFEPAVADALKVYLDRHYIYAPIRGERHYNRAIFSPSSAGTLMPRVMVSFDQSRLSGQDVHRVRLVDPASVTFNWRSSGPSVVRLAHAEIVRFIDQDSMLSVRTEERVVFEDGRRRESIRELAATDILKQADIRSDPFILDVPPATPVRWQSAREHLAGVAEALAQAARPTVAPVR